MYKTIINNDTIINSVIIKYSIYYNKYELLQLIPNPEEKDILLILSTMKKLKYYILPSTIYLNYFKYVDAYECFTHIKYLYNEDYDNIVKFLLGDNYQLTNEEFVIWIKNFNCLIPKDSGFSFDIIKLHEYVKKNCSNDIYEEFMQSYLKNNYVMKFIFCADLSFFINELNNIYFVTILENYFYKGISISEDVNFEKIVNIFENIVPIINEKVAYYLCVQYKTVYFYKYSVNNECIQTNLKCELDLNNVTYRLDDDVLTLPNYSLALWLVHHIELRNCNTLNDIQNKWNEYYEIITNNELLMYKDNYIVYDKFSSIILFSRDNDTVLVIPSFSSEISLDDLLKMVDVTKYRLTISYLVENNILINFSELIKKYSDDFFDFIKYLPNLIQYDIDIEDDIIEIIYNQTKNNIILEYILYDANSN